uniref:Uncharacterized protein n=1 Tax=Octopus bimaculoides TaxID=37653 RepID=A0A0L8FYB9_OCTBM
MRLKNVVYDITTDGLWKRSAKCSLHLFIIPGGFLITSFQSFNFKGTYDDEDGGPKACRNKL